MKAKLVFLLLLLFVTGVLSSLTESASSAPTVAMVPREIHCYVGWTFTVEVWASNLQTAIYSYWVWVYFDPSILNCIGADMPADFRHIFFGYPFIELSPVINNAAGNVLHGAAILGGPPAQTSGGLLTRLTFKCVGSGITFLNIITSFDPPVGIIIYQDGYFESIPHEITLTIEPQYSYYNAGENFTVNAEIAYVERLSVWQLEVSFNPSVLNCINSTYPPDHIFNGHSFTSWPPSIDNTIGYIRHNASLLGQDTKSGYGKLTQLTFQCVASGYSVLKIDAGTQLKDPDGNSIAFAPSDGYFHSTLTGDITGPTGTPDGKVDIRDVAAVAQLFGQPIELGDPRDLYPDGKIDIRDIARVAINFGQHWP